MANFRMYRTYRWLPKEKNPVLGKLQTIAQDEGVFKDLKALHEISGVSASTFHGWWHGDTVNPQHGTIMAFLTSLGYEERFEKTKDIDIEKERKSGKAWLEARAEEREKEAPRAKRKKKANGHAAPSMKRKYVGEKREA
ncbi:hypothetical protein KIP88_02475 [Bradyrhizobium sp. SRL28]|uniref:hypothetical protein n=1 Tax=Bradyrhizobium sp. SRL28 TaxID=2836178 RepID=UPI001BDDD4EF|nr:hypothetical protein [Bradyrhizobium sp. SRL28]MBT1509355.1 hypothetical protein [Bradyrhizobium sp. SRL28]